MPARPLDPEQKADAARLKMIFLRWRAANEVDGRKLSQEEIAASIGKKQSAFSQTLNGTLALNQESASAFAKLLGCSVADFSPTIAKKIAEQALSIALPQQSWSGKGAKTMKDIYTGDMTRDQAELRYAVLTHINVIPDALAKSLTTIILAAVEAAKQAQSSPTKSTNARA